MTAKCSLPGYTKESTNLIAVQGVIDPGQPISLLVLLSSGINSSEQIIFDEGFNVSIVEDGNLVFSEIIKDLSVNTSLIPKAGSSYEIKVSALNNPDLKFESHELIALHQPKVTMDFANDSVSTIEEKNTQVFQSITIQVDTTGEVFPFYAYSVSSDSSSLFGGDTDSISQTNNWNLQTGTFCPEVAEAAFFDGEFKILNLSCKSDQSVMSFFSEIFRPREHEYMDFKLCRIDDRSLDLLRQATQNGLYENIDADQQFLSIFLTKDDFPRGQSGYDLIINRGCIDYRVRF